MVSGSSCLSAAKAARGKIGSAIINSGISDRNFILYMYCLSLIPHRPAKYYAVWWICQLTSAIFYAHTDNAAQRIRVRLTDIRMKSCLLVTHRRYRPMSLSAINVSRAVCARSEIGDARYGYEIRDG